MPKDKQTKVQQKIYSAAKGLKQKLGISEKSENNDNANNDENNERNTKSNTPIMENKRNKRKGLKTQKKTSLLLISRERRRWNQSKS